MWWYKELCFLSIHPPFSNITLQFGNPSAAELEGRGELLSLRMKHDPSQCPAGVRESPYFQFWVPLARRLGSLHKVV
jgi:hypothetical protein